MIEPINFFGAVRKRWRLFVVLAVVGAVVALFVPISTPKHPKTVRKYETYALVGAPSSSGLLQGTVTSAQILFFADTFPVKLTAIHDVGLAGDPYQYLLGMISVAGAPSGKTAYPTETPSGASTTKGKASAGGGIVSLYAAAPTKDLAAKLANAYAKEVGIAIEKAATATAAASAAAKSASSAKSSASASSDGSSPATVSTGYQVLLPGTTILAHRINLPKTSQLSSHKVRLMAGLLAGILLALVITLGREVLDKTIRRSGRAEVHFKFPVVADIPESYPPDPAVVDVVDRPLSPAAEAYRKLRMSVLFEPLAADSQASGGPDPFADMFGVSSSQVEPYAVPEPGSRNVVLVVSTGDEPSRPKVVANLAATFAEASQRVVVVSTGDLEVGTALPAESILSGPLTPADVGSRLTPAGPDNVSMLSMRNFVRNSGQLVSRSKDVFDAARQVADVVVIEAPAFLRLHHGEAMAHSVDVVLVVAESGVTEVADAQDMGGVLRRLGAPVLGVVFTGVELPSAQRKQLLAVQAASARGRTTLESGGTGDEEPENGDEEPEVGAVPEGEPVSGGAPEPSPT
jgi:polysaccharide biosynthesis transport protein